MDALLTPTARLGRFSTALRCSAAIPSSGHSFRRSLDAAEQTCPAAWRQHVRRRYASVLPARPTWIRSFTMSRFFGIIIRMFAEPFAPHHRPHFHAYYQESVAVYSSDPVELLAGSLPLRQQRLVEAWAELHQMELA